MNASPLIRLLAFAAVAAAALLGVSCRTTKNPVKDFERITPRFVLENTEPGQYGTAEVVMPVSKVRIPVLPDAVLSEFEMTSVELIELEFGKGLLFRTTDYAARELFRMSVLNKGKRIVLLLNGRPMGVRRLDVPITDGALHMYLEANDDDLEEIARNLKGTIFDIQEKLNR